MAVAYNYYPGWKIYINNKQTKIYRINYKNIAKGKDIKQNVTLKADDTIIVP